jgi:hypothetical protein
VARGGKDRNSRSGQGAKKSTSQPSPEKRYRELKESSRNWDTRVQQTIKKARRAGQRGSA